MGITDDAWTEYWATGALHSCAGSFQGDYGGEIGGFWARVFHGLGDGDRVLDLCCGNGALGRLLAAREGFAGSGVAMDAVDAAAVAPGWLDTLPPPERARFRFHPGVDAGRLPFEDGAFDLCASQYGIEYAGPPAWDEARRVLSPGGRFAAVVHHAGSLPVRIAREEVAHLDWLQAPGGPLEAAGTLAPFMAMAAAPGGVERLNRDPDAIRARDAFRRAMQALEERAAGARYPDVLDEAAQPLAGALQAARQRGAAAAADGLRDASSAWALQHRRAAALVEVAMDREQLLGLAARISPAVPEPGELRFGNGEVAGWSIELRREG